MKQTGLLFLLCCLILRVASAQMKNLAEKQQIVNALGTENRQGAVQTFDERYKGVRGSPFMSDQWMDGRVHMRNGHVFKNIQIKYDLYRDQIVVKRRDGAEVIPEKARIQQFVLAPPAKDSLHFVRIDYLSNYRKFPPNHFAQVLYEGKSVLLAVHLKKFIKADYRGAYHADRPYDMFEEMMTSYYLIRSDGKAAKLKPNKKHVIRLLRDQQTAVGEFIEEEGVDVENPHDLVRLLHYYDRQ